MLWRDTFWIVNTAKCHCICTGISLKTKASAKLLVKKNTIGKLLDTKPRNNLSPGKRSDVMCVAMAGWRIKMSID